MPGIDPAWALAVLLLWARLGSLLTLSPLAQVVKAPSVFWVLFTLALSGTLCAALGLRAPLPDGVGGLSLLILGEAALGTLLGLSLHMAFAALSMAGRLLDLQMGFGMAAVLDPVTRANIPVVGVALTMLGMSAFLGGDGHHALLRGIAQIAQWVPPGAVWRLPDASLLARAMGVMFSMTIVVMAPALFMLLLTELVLDVTSRVLPQMNVLFIGMPVKALVGLSTLAIAAPGMAPALRRLFASVFEFWQGVVP
ncbi:flagellar biosynthetic protein FliR [Pelomonas saccharophila]|uniref:Flagellar biosynthetic protein FliR n=1 Tax=Roseateles saccharophilus TaxID=304 RepID=A0ABU1YHM6_ROSSA|nr:flagellar biosynthetic protein FliR [Roseateles saccharophilus]MDR7268228.1 flagellar biosynthetic protein FliR [Roseateles saccharophilus]